MSLEDLMREDVVTVKPDTDAGECARKMNREHVGSVVVTEQDSPVGIITDRDLCMKIVGAEKSPENFQVSDLMSEELYTANVEDGVAKILRTMYKNSIRRLPVVDGNKLVGIITLDDIVVLLSGEMQDISGVIQSESPPYEIDYDIM